MRNHLDAIESIISDEELNMIARAASGFVSSDLA